MTDDRGQYVQRVLDRIERVFAERLDELPTGMKIIGVNAAQSDWRMTVSLDAETEIEGWYDCEALFQEIAGGINDEFKEEKWFRGVEIRVPLRFLGKLGEQVKMARLEQDLDNSRFRSVRLQKGFEDDGKRVRAGE